MHIVHWKYFSMLCPISFPSYAEIIVPQKCVCIIFSTPLHRAVHNDNEAVFSILITSKEIDFDIQDTQGKTPLWAALSR